MKPVILPPGYAKLETSPLLIGSVIITNTSGVAGAACRSAVVAGVPCAKIASGARRARSNACVRNHAKSPSAQRLSMRIFVPSRPTKIRERACEGRNQTFLVGIVFGGPHQFSDLPHAFRLLRARRERPRGCHAAKQRYELAP